MFVGTSSNAGKTFITALFCRYLRSRTLMVSPFKAFNLSSRTFATDEGLEMGIGQALQAWASDLKPNVRMNPILMKAADGKLQLFVDGAEATEKLDRPGMLRHALASFDELRDIYEAVVVEGSGSPAEINLRDSDIANVPLASARKIPMILIGNIEKGGVFAGIYGTWRLLREDERSLLKGFIINKYYGDTEILKDGIEHIERLTGMKCFGILPYMHINLPEEDSSTEECQHSNGEIDEFISSLDSLLENVRDRIDMDGMMRIASE